MVKSVMRQGLTALALLLTLGAAGPVTAREGLDMTRRYTVGERFRYQLEQTETRGDRTTRVLAVSAHEVQPGETGAPAFESVRWLALGEPGGPDDVAARALAPYRLSLAADEGLGSPRPAGSVDLLGMVTDLQTFYVAISPALGVQRMRAIGDSWTRPELIIGEFADGEAILAGRDCTRATLRLTAIEGSEAVIESTFEPPEQSCLPEAAAGAAGTIPQNFHMVRRIDGGVLDLTGHERFVIVSRVRIADGALIAAEMVNQLDLEGRLCADATLSGCHAIPVIHRVRRVALTRLEGF